MSFPNALIGNLKLRKPILDSHLKHVGMTNTLFTSNLSYYYCCYRAFPCLLPSQRVYFAELFPKLPNCMSESNWIPFTDLPHSAGGLSDLYSDYLTDYQKTGQYFQADFHSLQSIAASAERIKTQFPHRAALVEVLNEQNRQFGASEKTMEHIRFLGEENTFAVVTGQQVGILGGPLYTIYKTITAIKLAQQLSETYPQYKFVPMFWLEGEDHDFEEINKVGLLDFENRLLKIEYLLNGKPLERNAGAVGEIQLDGFTKDFFEQVQKNLHNSEFKQPLFDMVQEMYSSGASFNTAFARLLNSLFNDSGLVFISVNDKQLKQLLTPVFQKEIQEFPRVSQLIIQQSAELEHRYHAQIKTKALNLFLFHKGGRYLIEPRETDFSLKGTRHYFSKDELLRIANETPELLSPNVALRPICQDTVLPTIAYVGGPSEIAYFAQLKPVYQYFNMTMPAIYPRASATIVEEKLERIIEKYELELIEFFSGINNINDKVIEMVSEVKIEEMFKEATNKINDLTGEMKFGLNYIDATLIGPLDGTRSKMESLLQVLKEKVSEAQKRKHEIALRQIQKVSGTIFPNNNFQERELSVIYFLNKYGPDFVKFLKNEVQIDRFEHQIIRL